MPHPQGRFGPPFHPGLHPSAPTPVNTVLKGYIVHPTRPPSEASCLSPDKSGSHSPGLHPYQSRVQGASPCTDNPRGRDTRSRFSVATRQSLSLRHPLEGMRASGNLDGHTDLTYRLLTTNIGPCPDAHMLSLHETPGVRRATFALLLTSAR